MGLQSSQPRDATLFQEVDVQRLKFGVGYAAHGPLLLDIHEVKQTIIQILSEILGPNLHGLFEVEPLIAAAQPSVLYREQITARQPDHRQGMTGDYHQIRLQADAFPPPSMGDGEVEA